MGTHQIHERLPDGAGDSRAPQINFTVAGRKCGCDCTVKGDGGTDSNGNPDRAWMVTKAYGGTRSSSV
jgi:hypothetical protein